jgi:hypothetical protein
VTISIYDRCLDYTLTIVKSVDGIGVVHDHLILPREESEFRDAFLVDIGDQKQYRGWMVTSTPSNTLARRVITPTQDEELIALQLHGYRAITGSGESEREFRNLCESLGDALSEKVRAGETGGTPDPQGYIAIALPAQIKAFRPGKVAGVWMHYALLEYALKVHVHVTRS